MGLGPKLRTNPIPRRAKWIAAALAAACLLVSLGGIAGRRQHMPRLAFIPRTTGSTLWEAEHAGASSAARDRAQIYWNAPTHEDDVEDQIALVERVQHAHFDGLVLAPAHSLALLSPVEHVLSSGIPVIVVASQLSLPTSRNLAYIVNDEEQAGRLAADRVGDVLRGEGRIAVLGLNPNMAGILDRLRAFEANLRNHSPGIQVVFRGSGAFNAAEAQQATISALSFKPEVNAIVALTAVSTRAGYFTVKNTPLLADVKIIGFEQDGEMTDAVRRGEIDSIVAEDTYGMGAAAVDEMLAMRRGYRVPAKRVLAPVLVTRENADSDQVKRLINMTWFDEN